MGIRVFDFKCPQGHVAERFEDAETRAVECSECDQLALRQIATPRAVLEGFSGAFPTAADAWERRRESHMRKERKIMDNHNTYK